LKNLKIPLTFTPRFEVKVWGGERLKQFAPEEKGTAPIGEMWLLSDVPGRETLISNGPLAGMHFNELSPGIRQQLLGAEEEAGPLLIKLIDAGADLSIQVHPDDAYAQKHHGSNGKSEMWMVLECEPEASLVAGFTPGHVNRSARKLENIESLIQKHPVKPGDGFYIPAGRIHAIGKGILLAEVQQSSDLTYRVYDYNRPGLDGRLRELHLKQSLDVLNFEDTCVEAVRSNPGRNEWDDFISCTHFRTTHCRCETTWNRINENNKWRALLCLKGCMQVTVSGCSPVQVDQYQLVFIPAITKDFEVSPNGEEAEWLEIWR